MKITPILMGLAMAGSVSGADTNSILLRGATVSTQELKATGAAKAVVGEMTVTAETIAFDQAANTLRCEGEVTLRVAGNVVSTRDCTIALAPGEKKIHLLSADRIHVSPSTEARHFPSAPTDLVGSTADRDKAVHDLNYRLLKSSPANSAEAPVDRAPRQP